MNVLHLDIFLYFEVWQSLSLRSETLTVPSFLSNMHSLVDVLCCLGLRYGVRKFV